MVIYLMIDMANMVKTINIKTCFTVWMKTLSTLLFSVLVFGCSDSSKLNSLTKKSLIYCSEASPETFNPQITIHKITLDATSNQLYDRLITIDPVSNKLVPSLAKSWHVTRDGKMVTFYLRKDIAFHETDYFYPTRSMNADDVLFSFQRILHPEHEYNDVSSGRYPYFEQIKFNNIVASIEKINDLTIRFNLNRPDASFLSHLATQYAVILSAEYADLLTTKNTKHYIDTQPIGTGPFKLKEYRAGSMIRFNKHLSYWRTKVNFDQLVYDITTSNTGRLTKLMTGECDIISDPIGHNKITERKDLTLQSVTSIDVSYLALNTLKPPFNSGLVRQAISKAINKEAIINAVYLGHGIKANNILPPSTWHLQDVSLDTLDIAGAKFLLNKAGYADGFEMSLWAPIEASTFNPNPLASAIMIKDDLSKIGITVKIIHQTPPVILGISKIAVYDSTLSGRSVDQPDPGNFLSPILSCTASETGTNLAFWCNQEFDSLLVNGLQTDKVEQRKLYYQKALNILAQQTPIIPIAHSKTYKAKNNKIEGEFFNNFGISFINVSKN